MVSRKNRFLRGVFSVLWAISGTAIMAGCVSVQPRPLANDYTLSTFQEAARWPNQQPVLLLATMQLFYSTGRAREGAQYFHALSEIYPDRALLKACEGTLMAKIAYDVSLFQRIGWVNGALAKLDEAAQDGTVETLYLKALVESELPGFIFGRARAAVDDLNAVLKRQNELPFEADRSLHAALARAYFTLGDARNSAIHLQAAGLPSLDGPHVLSNNPAASFLSTASVSAEDGYRFVAPRVVEIANKLWVVQGYDFANIIAWETSAGVVLVDSGTTIAAAEKAKAALRTVTQKPIHTIIITHAHWDHIGGISVFREPGTKIIANARYERELQTINNAPLPFKYLFGLNIKNQSYEFKPDHLVRKAEALSVGNLQLRLIPASGGETADALIVYDTQSRIAVVGDVLMPYLGAPWVAQGSPEQLVETINILQELNAIKLIHGHDPLTRYFNVGALAGLEQAIQATIASTTQMISAGMAVAEILRTLALPEGLKTAPHAVFPFLVMREGLIQRIASEGAGYWNADGAGIDPVTQEEMALAMNLTGAQTASAFIQAGENLISRGDVILAVRVLKLGTGCYPENTKMQHKYLAALDRLRERNHLINPFKFAIYSEMGGKELKPVMAMD